MIKIFWKVTILFVPFMIISIMMLTSCLPSEQYLMKKKWQNRVHSRNVRILICRTDNIINITAGEEILIREKKSGTIRYRGNGKNIKIMPEKVKEPIVISSRNHIVQLNGNGYRGIFEMHNIMGKICVVNVLTLEEYLYSVVPSEIPALWPKESLKAQAVAARTYTLHHLMTNGGKSIYDLDATTNFQVYKGISVESPHTTRAVDETGGEFLESRHKPILAYFHSTCGGKTADDHYVWQGNDLPYLHEVRCPYCSGSPSYRWETQLSISMIKNTLKRKHKNIGSIRNISFKKRSGRVTDVIIRHRNGTIAMTGNEFRLLFPPKTLKSLYFKSSKKRYGLHIRGKGWGHGVGMCQYGARGMAEKGLNYKRILKYYYRGVYLNTLKGFDKRFLAGY